MTERCVVQRSHGEIVELCLDRKPMNALSHAACEQWMLAIGEAVAAGAEAIVLSGPPGVFSTGADLRELTLADRQTFEAICRSLAALASEIAHCPVPIVGALTGHCLGGASGVALQCDTRVMATGPYRFRINYVAMGLVPPPFVRRALERIAGGYHASRLLVGAVPISPEEALALGIVESLHEPPRVVDAALEVCRRLLSLPRGAMLETRRHQRAELSGNFADGERSVGDLTRQWFDPDTQARVAKMLESRQPRAAGG